MKADPEIAEVPQIPGNRMAKQNIFYKIHDV